MDVADPLELDIASSFGWSVLILHWNEPTSDFLREVVKLSFVLSPVGFLYSIGWM